MRLLNLVKTDSWLPVENSFCDVNRHCCCSVVYSGGRIRADFDGFCNLIPLLCLYNNQKNSDETKVV